MSTQTRNRAITLFAATLMLATALAGCVDDGRDDDDSGGAAGVMTTCGNNALALNNGGGGGGESVGEEKTLIENSVDIHDRIPSASFANVLEGEELHIGTMLPLTGGLGQYGPDMESAVRLAVNHLQAAAQEATAGTGLGSFSIRLTTEDSQSSPEHAPTAMDRLIAAGVTAVVGAAGSGVTASILDRAAQNDIVVVSPASTSPALTQEDERHQANRGYFFRMPPDDGLQGRLLAELVENDGCQSAVILAVNNAYGQGLADSFRASFGGQIVGTTIFFADGATVFGAELERVEQAAADAVVVIGYPGEGQILMQAAYERGVTQDSVFFFSEGLKSPEFVQQIGRDQDGAWIISGLGGTTPISVESDSNANFVQAFEDEYNREPGLFAAESYDATIAIGLAAVAARSADGQAIRDNMRAVWNSPGERTHDLVQAMQLLVAGQTIDWVGASGDNDWDDRGDPIGGAYAYWVVRADGTIAHKDIPS